MRGEEDARQGWTLVGVLLTGAMVVLSAFINYQFGYSLGTTETNAHTFGAVSVVAVIMMAVLPLRISTHWEAGRKGRVLLGGVMFGVLVAYAVTGSIGFGMRNRSQRAGSRETLNAQLTDHVAERNQAVDRLKGLNEDRPAAAISAKIEAARKDRRWDQTEGCTNATALSSRDFCQGVDRLRAQLNVAASAAGLREKVERLNKLIEDLRGQGAGQIVDPQSYGLAMMLGTEQDAIRVGLSMLLALVIESVCCFGLLVIVGVHPRGKTEVEITLPEWFGKWLSERAEPARAARTNFSELEADFWTWGHPRGSPKLSSRRFARLVVAACAELGLATDGTVVVGLQLSKHGRLLTLA